MPSASSNLLLSSAFSASHKPTCTEALGEPPTPARACDVAQTGVGCVPWQPACSRAGPCHGHPHEQSLDPRGCLTESAELHQTPTGLYTYLSLLTALGSMETGLAMHPKGVHTLRAICRLVTPHTSSNLVWGTFSLARSLADHYQTPVHKLRPPVPTAHAC
eukprot:690953-Pelagomonas_calceolata.AAC.2